MSRPSQRSPERKPQVASPVLRGEVSAAEAERVLDRILELGLA